MSDFIDTETSLDEYSMPVRSFRLQVTKGVDAGAEGQFESEHVVIGKGEGVSLRLSDPKVSRVHIELVSTPGGVLLRDLGSKNGTYLGDVRVHQAVLGGRCLLSLGDTQVLFEPLTAKGRVALSRGQRFGPLVGESSAMRRAFFLLERAALVRSSVLVQGEPGTGKGEAARALHDASDAAAGPFVLFDCAAVPSELCERELFSGALPAARGGTLVLEEVGDLSPAAQARLGRAFLQKEGGLGEPRGVRLISLTSHDLLTEVNRRNFRSDLFHLLAVIVITLPPLRERGPDIPLLLESILDDLAAGGGPRATGEQKRVLLSDAQQRLWPANLRELRAYVERFLVTGGSPPVPTTSDIWMVVDTDTPLRKVRAHWNDQLERRYLEMLLQRTGWNVSAAARIAGVEREHLHRLLRQHNLQRPR